MGTGRLAEGVTRNPIFGMAVGSEEGGGGGMFVVTLGCAGGVTDESIGGGGIGKPLI